MTATVPWTVRLVHSLDGISQASGKKPPNIYSEHFISVHFGLADPTVYHRFLYALTLSIDANFRLKLKDRGIKDVRLGLGRAYCVDEDKFEQYIKGRTFTTEVRGTRAAIFGTNDN